MTDDGPAGQPMAERMQALLTRAVEDQLSEQRQLSTVLTEIRAVLTRLPHDVQGAVRAGGDSRLDALTQQTAALSDEMRARTGTLLERLETAIEAVNARTVDDEELHQQLAWLSDQQRSQGATLNALRQAMDALPAFPDHLAALQTEVGSLMERLRGIDEVRDELGTLAGRVAELAGLDDALRSVRSGVDGLSARVGSLPQRDELDGVAYRLAERFDALDARVARLESVLTPLAARVGELHDRLDALPVEALERRVGAVGDEVRQLGERLATKVAGEAAEESALSDLREEVQALGDEVAEVTDRVGELSAVRDDVAVLRTLVGGDSGLVAELAELRSAVEARQQQPAPSVSPELITAAVRAETGGLERRLTEHVDEAVLALAEAMLRRRGLRRELAGGALADVERPTDRAPSLSVPPPPPPPEVMAEQAADEEEEAEEPTDETPLVGLAEAVPDEQDELEPFDDEEDEADLGPVAALRTLAEEDEDEDEDEDELEPQLLEEEEFVAPAPAEVAAGHGWSERHGDFDFADGDDTAALRRRPWWRPGG